MEKIFTAPHFTFENKKKADEFLGTLRKMLYKYDVITVNDVMNVCKRPIQAEYYIDGLHFGYVKKDIQKIEPEKISKTEYVVKLPMPGRMVRGPHGYWTTEERKDEN